MKNLFYIGQSKSRKGSTWLKDPYFTNSHGYTVWGSVEKNWTPDTANNIISNGYACIRNDINAIEVLPGTTGNFPMDNGQAKGYTFFYNPKHNFMLFIDNRYGGQEPEIMDQILDKLEAILDQNKVMMRGTFNITDFLRHKL